jgi:hypothetical protein
MTPFYHGDITDEGARELLSVMRHGGAASGNFLYGDDGKGYFLWVLHEGDVTVHSIKVQDRTGQLLYNGRASGTSTLSEVSGRLLNTCGVTKHLCTHASVRLGNQAATHILVQVLLSLI